MVLHRWYNEEEGGGGVDEEEEPYALPKPLICSICGLRFERWDAVSAHALAGHNFFDEA